MRWIDVTSSNAKIGDFVRVKENAYGKVVGKIHNDRYCVVTEIRDGDVIVRSVDGMTPELTATHHSPHVLEKRV